MIKSFHDHLSNYVSHTDVFWLRISLTRCYDLKIKIFPNKFQHPFQISNFFTKIPYIHLFV